MDMASGAYLAPASLAPLTLAAVVGTAAADTVAVGTVVASIAAAGTAAVAATALQLKRLRGLSWHPGHRRKHMARLPHMYRNQLSAYDLFRVVGRWWSFYAPLRFVPVVLILSCWGERWATDSLEE